jgi:hypothetical protein
LAAKWCTKWFAFGLVPGKFTPGRGGDVGAGVGVAVDAPSTLGGLGDQDPGALGERRVAPARTSISFRNLDLVP